MVADLEQLKHDLKKDVGNHCVYIITCLINGKQYVGYTSQGLKTRWMHHVIKAKKGVEVSLYFGIRKHGAENFVPAVIREGLTRAEAEKAEQFLIKALKLNDRRFGYNMTEGGEGGVPTEEVIARICTARGMVRDPLCQNKFYAVSLPTAQLIKEYETTSSPDLAKKYGCSSGTILKRLKDAGVKIRSAVENGNFAHSRGKSFWQTHPPNNVGRKASEEVKKKMRENNGRTRRDVSDEEVIQLYVSGSSSLEIAKKFGISATAIQRRLRLNGVQSRHIGRQTWKTERG